MGGYLSHFLKTFLFSRRDSSSSLSAASEGVKAGGKKTDNVVVKKKKEEKILSESKVSTYLFSQSSLIGKCALISY